MAGREAKTETGSELMASTGMRHRETQVAWAMKAPRNLGGEVRMEAKRESAPSALMRWKRYVPTGSREGELVSQICLCGYVG